MPTPTSVFSIIVNILLLLMWQVFGNLFGWCPFPQSQEGVCLPPIF